LISKIKEKSTSNDTLDVFEFTDEEHFEAAVELLESWLATKRLCESVGAKFICILQPHIFIGKPSKEHLYPNLIKWQKMKSFEYYEDVLELLETDKYQNLKENFINMTSIFDGIPLIYIDFRHVSHQGNEIIANRIAEYLTTKENE
jgi:hypothetical protein